MKGRTPMNKLASVALAITTAGVLTACGSSSGSSDDSGDITIGSIHPTSGPLAGVGSLMDDGAKMAVADINAKGGIKALDGRKLKLSSGDSQSKPEVGQSEAQRMIDDGAVALVGTYESAVTQNVASVAERGRVPLVIDVAVDDNILEKGYKYSFRVQPNATSMGTSGAESLAAFGKQAGDPVTRVAYLHVEGSFGDSVFDAFKEKASEQGITDVKEITYPPTNFSDATTQVREAASYKPDVIVATGYFPDGVLIAKAVEELKPDIKGLYGIANGAFDDGSFPEAAGTAAAGVLGANYHYDAKSAEVQDIRKRFEQKYGKPMETASVLSYQAVEVVAAGLEEAKDADPEKLRDAIADIEIDKPLLAFDGPIKFDDKGQNENATVIVMQNLKGSIAQVYPEEFAEQKIQFPAAAGTQ